MLQAVQIASVDERDILRPNHCAPQSTGPRFYSLRDRSQDMRDVSNDFSRAIAQLAQAAFTAFEPC